MSKDALGLTPEQRKVFEALLTKKGITPVAAEGGLSHDEARRFEPFPMTDVQASYLLGRSAQFELGNVASHGYQEFDCAELDVARYEDAWNRVIARHDMLRAVALPDATQVVSQSVPRFRVDVVDLTGLPASEREARLVAIREEMSHRVPDPAAWPMFRVRISLLGAGRARIHFSSDALLTDIFSAAIIQEEILHFYRDPACKLPEPELTFRDCVQHEKARERTQAFAASERYWQEKLDQLAPAPELPLLPLGSLTAPRFQRRSFQIQDYAGLTARAAEHAVTPSALVLAAYVEALRRFSRHPGFTLNVTVFQRPGAAARVVGDFTSTMLFGVPSGGTTFAARLAELQAALLRDLDHSQVSGIRVGRALAARRGSTGRALMPIVFTSMLGLGRLGERLEEGQKLGELQYMITQTPQVVLDHQLYQQADGSLQIVWDVVEKAFLPGVLDAMFTTYRRLLSQLCRADRAFFERTSVVELPAEQRRAREEANATGGSLPTEPLHAGFRRHCALQPERVGLVSGEKRYTYGRLGELVSALVRVLRARGVGRGSLVALVMERGFEQVVGALAVVEAGGAYVPIDGGLPALRVQRLLAESGAAHVLTQPWLTGRFVWPSQVEVCSLVEGELTGEDTASEDITDVQSTDVAYVIYTSGSTGTPKGVVVTHGAAQNTIADINERFEVSPADRVLGLSSLSFDLSVYDIFGVLGAGGCLVQVEAGSEKDPARWTELMRQEGVTLWNSVPALMQMLVDFLEGQADHQEPLTLRCVLMSGDWIPRTLAPRIRKIAPAAEVISLGGATEASIWSIFHRMEGELEGWTSVPYGKPLKNQRWYVLNERWEDCPEGVAGELYIGGAGLAEGYHRDSERTAARFVRHPRTGERLYRTGDLGRYRAGGVLEFLGREDTQVKVGGHRIELGEIESVLSSHPEVKQALVVARGGARSASKTLAGYVVLERPGSVSASELREHAAQQLPEYMVPRVIMELEALPLSSNGKVDRAALPEPVKESALDRAAPSTRAEGALVELWRELLGRDQVGVRDHFFELGGDSLIATRLSAELRGRYALELSVRALLSEPILERAAALARAIGKEDAVEPQEPSNQAEAQVWPLSFAQERFWFFEQLLGPNGAYNIPVALQLTAGLDVALLQRALDALAARHEMLRTRFVLRDGQMGQVIEESTVPLTVRHFAQCSSTEPDGALRAWLIEEAARPFSLGQGKLIRASLAMEPCTDGYGPSRHVLLLTLHHAVADGWSLAILLNELAELYGALREHRAPRLASPGLRYTEHARREREGALDASHRAKLAVVCSRLADAPQLLALPLDRPRPPARTLRGDTVSFELSPERCATLRAYAAERGGTAYMALLAVFSMLLARVSDSDDIVIGSPVANRERSDVSGVVGVFVNTLALRVDLSGDPSFETAFARCRELCLEGLVHQDVPFEQVVETLRPPRATSHSPIFQAMLAYQGSGNEPTRFADLAVQPYELPRTTALFDLTLHLHDTGEVMRGLLEFATDVFERSTAIRLAQQYQELLEAALREPSVPFSALWAGSSSGESAPVARLDGPPLLLPQYATIAERFADVARHCPDAPALRWTGGQLSYASLAHAMRTEAARLDGLGVRRGDVVGVLMPRDPGWVVTQLALFWLGAVYLPLEARWPSSRRAFVLEDSRAKFLICPPEEQSAWKALEPIHVVPCALQAALAANAEHESAAPPTAAAYVIYTSGSTGRPKGVPIAQSALLNLVHAMQAPCRLGPGTRVLQFASGAFDASIWEVFGALGNGGCLCIGSEEERTPGKPLAEFVARHAVSHALLTPSVLALIEPGSLATCTTLLVGGEACPPELARSWAGGRRLLNAYGPTECAVIVTLGPIAPDASRVGLGDPIANTCVCILGEQGQPVEVGATGELCIAGAGVMAGYLNRPELDAEKFVSLSEAFGRNAEGRWYRTGDRVRLLSDGTLEYLGRLDRQIKLRGLRIELGEIEAAIAELPSVRACAVVVACDAAGERRIVAHVVLEQAVERSGWQHSAREQLAASLPAYMLPSHFIVRDALPMTSSGKADFVALEQESAAGWRQDTSGQASDRAPSSPHERGGRARPLSERERTVLRIWREITGASELGPDDDFFAAGGHSLSAVRAVQRMRDEAALEVPLQGLFRYPRLRELLGAYDQKLPTRALGADGLRWLHRRPAGPVVVCLDAPGEPPDRFALMARALDGAARIALIQLGDGGEAWEVEALAARVVHVLDQADITQSVAAVVGWSFAAALAFAVASHSALASSGNAQLYLLDGLAPSLVRGGHNGLPRDGATQADPWVGVDAVLRAELGSRYETKLNALASYRPGRYERSATVVATQTGGPSLPADRGWNAYAAAACRVVEVDCAHEDLLKRESTVSTIATLIKEGALHGSHG